MARLSADQKLKERFERSVDRSGEHHLWTGAKNPQRGTGRVNVAGRQVTAHRLAWELENGSVPAACKVLACPDEPACVRIEHLSLLGDPGQIENGGRKRVRESERQRSKKGAGSMREIRPGVWKLTVTVGTFDDGRARRRYRQVFVPNATAAAKELSAFVAEVRHEPAVMRSDRRDLNFDEAVQMYLNEYLLGEKGRDERTVRDYVEIHRRWFAPHAGGLAVRDVTEAMIDQLFGRMRKAGLSGSRLNHAKSLYSPFFRWAMRRGLTTRNPMAAFQVPTSMYVAKERTPPEAEELSLLLQEAVVVVPDVAP
ncbi:MAG: HNH endonuclease, partial [Acidimicrobiia bacterium]